MPSFRFLNFHLKGQTNVTNTNEYVLVWLMINRSPKNLFYENRHEFVEGL